MLTADLPLAERVLAGDAELDRARSTCEEQAQSLLALQAPVAGDLRTILAAVYCAEKIERMGDLAAHIADTARFTHPEHAVPAEFEGVFTGLGGIAADMADRVGELIAGDAGGGFAELDETDQAVDALHARVLASITGEGWAHGGALGHQPGAGGPLLRAVRRPGRLGRQTSRVRRNRAGADQ